MCANIDFLFPGRLVSVVMPAATGVDPDDDPWLPERSVWAMTAAWVAGEDTHGLGNPLPPDVAWQATLWRRCAVAVTAPNTNGMLARIAVRRRA